MSMAMLKRSKKSAPKIAWLISAITNETRNATHSPKSSDRYEGLINEPLAAATVIIPRFANFDTGITGTAARV